MNPECDQAINAGSTKTPAIAFNNIRTASKILILLWNIAGEKAHGMIPPIMTQATINTAPPVLLMANGMASSSGMPPFTSSQILETT